MTISSLHQKRPFKAIETGYAGCLFRSRLEARWAIFFDALGIEWEYEPEGFELGGGIRYLPDFLVGDTWFEVKPKGVADTRKVEAFAETGANIVLLDGLPDAVWYRAYNNGGFEIDCICFVPQESKYAPWFHEYCGSHENAGKRPNELGCDYEDSVWDAIRTARSARFEHGARG